MKTLSVLTALVRGGMSPIAACAMGGNMMAESGMKSNIAQRDMTKLTDEQYTAAADAGTINFANDSVGYGLCQWTYRTRKKNLLDYAKSMGASVGDEAMQVQFCLAELKTDYPSLWKYLKTATDLYEAAAKICREYERLAINNIEVRAQYANQLYMQYGDLSACGTSEPLSHSATAPMTWEPRGGKDDAEPASYIMGVVKYGEHTPEAEYLKALLQQLGYDVCWLGLDACLRDFQQKRGLTVDGVCGERTWYKVIEEAGKNELYQ